MRGGNWEETQENRTWENTETRDFSVIVDPYFWKLLKNDDDNAYNDSDHGD